MKYLIADDHEIIRKGLVQILLEYSGNIEVDEAENGEQVLKKIKNCNYDLLIMDITMPLKSGIDVLVEIARNKIVIDVLVLSIHPSNEYALRVFKLGAKGYISKDKAAEELVKAIETIQKGRKFISDEIAQALLNYQTTDDYLPLHNLLSDREYEVFIKLVGGSKIKEIADKLFLSSKTVSTYKKRILQKIGVKGVSELTKYAIQHDIL